MGGCRAPPSCMILSRNLWEMQGSKFQPWSFWSHRPGVEPGVQIFSSLFQVIWLQPSVSRLFPCSAASSWTLAGTGNSLPTDRRTPGRVEQSVRAQLTLDADGWMDRWTDGGMMHEWKDR